MATTQKTRVRKFLGLTDIQKLAKSKGGKCLSETYVNAHTPLRWQCQLGHIWEATPSNVTRGSWCPQCGRESARQKRIGKNRLSPHDRKVGLASLKAVAVSQGGKCLSTEYIGTKGKYRFRCSEGHEWEALGSGILQGSWCRRCAFHQQKHTLSEFQKAAEEKGGRCLSREYIGWEKSLKFICANGHRWQTQPRCIFAGQWCGQCYRDSIRGSLEKMQAIAASRGGECLSRRYVNAKTHLLWQCHKGHQWRAIPSAVSYGTWCPQCSVRERAEGAEYKPRRKRRHLNE